jgi:bifunctional DNase/RNase
VRLDVPIYVDEDVMDRAGQLPASEFEDGEEELEESGDDELGVFREFIEGIDMDDIAGED